MILPRSARWAACLALGFALLSAAAPAADPAPTPIPKWDPARTTNPEDLTEVKSLQNTVNKIVDKCSPATVALYYGSSTGSGVIINEDGLVLTAAHVIRDYAAPKKGSLEGLPLPFTSGKKVTVQLADGRKVEGKTLGINEGMDSGMIQITTKGPNDGKWPFAPMGKSGAVKKDQWVLTLGHPNGPKDNRPPVARLGRVYVNNSGFLRTDCAIVGGDSGGPLFDLNGNVIGIHSRMVFPYSLAHNIHVPTDDFRTDWDKLVAGDWVDKPLGKPYLGVEFASEEDDDAWLRVVEPDGAADKAGMKPGDTITKFNDTVVKSVKQFRKLMEGVKPGDKVKMTVRRSTSVLTLTVTLAKRP